MQRTNDQQIGAGSIVLEEPETINHIPITEIYRFLKSHDFSFSINELHSDFGIKNVNSFWGTLRFIGINKKNIKNLKTISEADFKNRWHKYYLEHVDFTNPNLPHMSLSEIHQLVLKNPRFDGIAPHLRQFVYVNKDHKERCLSIFALKNIPLGIAREILGVDYDKPMTKESVQKLYDGLLERNLLKDHEQVQSSQSEQSPPRVEEEEVNQTNLYTDVSNDSTDLLNSNIDQEEIERVRQQLMREIDDNQRAHERDSQQIRLRSIALEEPKTIDHIPLIELYHFLKKSGDYGATTKETRKYCGLDSPLTIYCLFQKIRIYKIDIHKYSIQEIENKWNDYYLATMKRKTDCRKMSFAEFHAKCLHFKLSNCTITPAIRAHLRGFTYFNRQLLKERCLSIFALKNIPLGIAQEILGADYDKPMTNESVQKLYDGLLLRNLLKDHEQVQSCQSEEQSLPRVEEEEVNQTSLYTDDSNDSTDLLNSNIDQEEIERVKQQLMRECYKDQNAHEAVQNSDVVPPAHRQPVTYEFSSICPTLSLSMLSQQSSLQPLHEQGHSNLSGHSRDDLQDLFPQGQQQEQHRNTVKYAIEFFKQKRSPVKIVNDLKCQPKMKRLKKGHPSQK